MGHLSSAMTNSVRQKQAQMDNLSRDELGAQAKPTHNKRSQSKEHKLMILHIFSPFAYLLARFARIKKPLILAGL